MSGKEKMPSYMAQLLEQLGWHQGTRIPLADVVNQDLETVLIARQNEIQCLKEALVLQNQKQEDLNKYKTHVHSEYQENTRLLFAQKQQLEQEAKLHQLSHNEINRLDKDVADCQKDSKNITARIDRLQINIAKLLKKADSLKGEVCGERGALQEWRAALERGAGDISAIEQFTKQDLSKAKALELKRQQLKLEHDRTQEHLNQLISNLSAEERACERISVQVIEGMEQRKEIMMMWAGAVENLRQRDTDIRHIREDYAVLEVESNNVAEKCREQQLFFDQQKGNNAEAQRENMSITQQLSQARLAHQQLLEINVNLDSEHRILQHELSNLRLTLEKLHMENRQIMEKQHGKDMALKAIKDKIFELKVKLIESTDKSKSSEKRAKELEEMLNEEERFASQLTVNQQRAMHCSFVEQQKLLALNNEQKLFHMQLKASKAIMSKLNTKQQNLERSLQAQKETFYIIKFQVETIGSRVAHMEGAQAERECSAELVERENRLKGVIARHAARVALLERHSAKLMDDMRRLSRDLEAKTSLHNQMQSRLRTSMLNVEGSGKEAAECRERGRRLRVDEALLRLRVQHAARALAGLDDQAFTIDKQRLQLQAAMDERLAEIAARRGLFGAQRRALLDDCGRLRTDIREREQRIEQLKKRYDIFIGSLGKDDSGQQLSVTFFKIKFAGERAALRERGAALDAELTRRERDIGALEHTLRLVHAAHRHFMHRITPLQQDTPEIEELRQLSEQYYALSDELKGTLAACAQLEQRARPLAAELELLQDKAKQLAARLAESESEFESLRERISRQQERLGNAREVVRYNLKRAKKLIDSIEDWTYFQVSLWLNDLSESAYSCVQALSETVTGAASDRLGALLSATDVVALLTRQQRRLRALVLKTIDSSAGSRKESTFEVIEESVFSSSSDSMKSGVSIASGYTKRLTSFRKNLAMKVQEQALLDDIPEQVRRSTVSLRVVTLGLEDSSTQSVPTSASAEGRTSRKTLK